MNALQAKAHGAALRPGLFSGVSAEKAGEMAEEGLDREMSRKVKGMREKNRVSRKLKE
jgi:hypothetical protein